MAPAGWGHKGRKGAYGMCMSMIVRLMVAALLMGAFMLTIYAIIHYDRVVVTFLRYTGLHLYPTAINIAMLIIEHPTQWTHDKYYMRHPVVGGIWICNEAYGLHIETEFGDWKPNVIERRIIRDAVDWRIKDFVRSRILLAMQRNALPNR
jgi:hypothetical protein